MGRSLGRKFLDFLWGPADDDYPPYAGEYGDYEEPAPDGYEELPSPFDEEPARPARRRSWAPARSAEEVVEIRPPRQPRAEVHYPKTFENAKSLADQFKAGSCLVVDLQQVDEKDRGGIVSFLYGIAYGLDGDYKRVNDLTFVFAPRHFDLSSKEQPQESLSGEAGTRMPSFQRTSSAR